MKPNQRFRSGPPESWTEREIRAMAAKLVAWMEEPDNFWLGDFAQQEKIPRQYLSKWADRDEVFKQAYDTAMQMQENKIVKGGLRSKFNPAMAIFTLKNNHGWRDKHETELTGGMTIEDVLRYEDEERARADAAVPPHSTGSNPPPPPAGTGSQV